MGSVEYNFTDETVVITGASSGIGRAMAREFGAAGATVLNADIQSEPKDINAEMPTHELVDEFGGTGVYLETDVSEPAEIEAVIDAAGEYGGVDVMVNNAALSADSPMLEVTPADFERIHRVNVDGVFFGCQYAANDMIERGESGAIINTASISSNVTQFDQVQYDSTKGAVRMITRGCALELAEYDIRVNAVAPGQIATEFGKGWTDAATRGAQENEFIKPVPAGRAGTPADVAGSALFLASDHAEYITGELLHVDGGWQII
ncbi:SDR family oxidoreductase [Natronolimnobius sp. AArcel1]|uniref:SDR family NAD(P)-dependent oxidoreductase n=1 Tax=Natronolimnobius sp. AArcel1 TaxID=1679093 RepID=UPI0013EC6694|nr:SDR family NAD(P)-dependent oxidoreductase [Natronolimnobius sp. AArcel1]NGM69151.1 SDR family oxidoreductase [Natronolimnobius sp. AArcel1]